MATFGAQVQALAPLFLGIGSQANGDPAGIARGIALMQAKQERDQRKAAIDNMMAGMGIAGPEKAFLSSLPEEMKQQFILQQMAPKEPVRGVVIGNRLVHPFTGETIANYGPEPLPADLFGDGTGGGGFNVTGNARMQGVSDPALAAMNTFTSRWAGPQVNVTSAYRDKDYNAAVGGASKSQHIDGNAFDIDTRGWSLADKQAAVQTALESGFNGVGVYDNSLHFDVAGRRAWGPSYTNKDAPDWAKQMVASVPAAQGGRVGPYRDAAGTAQRPAQAAPQVAQIDANIDRMTAILASGQGTPEQRKQLEFKRTQLVSERDRLIAQNEKDHLAALRARAEAGGLEEDSPEWQQFMLNNGAGGTAFTVSPDGTVSYGTGAAAANVKPPTEMQSRLSLFGGMMSATSPGIDALENRWNPANLKDNAAGRMGWAGNYMRSEDAQKYETLGLAWAEGALRMSTGAAATEPEIVRVFKTYFAQPGDSAETIALKRTQRKRFEEALSAASGAAAPAVKGGKDMLADATAEEVSSGSREPAGQIDLPPDLQALFEQYPAPAGR